MGARVNGHELEAILSQCLLAITISGNSITGRAEERVRSLQVPGRGAVSAIAVVDGPSVAHQPAGEFSYHCPCDLAKL